MADLLRVILGYADYGIEVAAALFLLVLLFRGRGKGLLSVAAYVLASVGAGGLRMYAAFRFGPFSHQYALYYWLTDFVIVLAVYLLICYFFRRASLGGAPRLWPHVRLMLVAVFVLTVGVSYLAVSRHHAAFFPYFVLEFQQDLYFVCLILATMLYLLVVQYASGDQQLGLLVCGLGIEYAGFAASLALVHVAGGSSAYGVVAGLITPLCDIGMTLVWLYTAVRVPLHALAPEARTAPKALPVGQLAHIG